MARKVKRPKRTPVKRAKKSKPAAPTKTKPTKKPKPAPPKKAKKRAKPKKPTRGTPKLKLTPRQIRERARDKKRRKKSARQRTRRAERRIAEQIAAETADDDRAVAIGWLEMLTPPNSSLTITEAESTTGTPWLVVGRIDLAEAQSYAEVAEILRAWENDLIAEATIGPQRMAQIRVLYNDPNFIAKTKESTWVSEVGPWSALVSDLRGEMDPNKAGSLATRYKNTAIPTIYVYFSMQQASAVTEI